MGKMSHSRSSVLADTPIFILFIAGEESVMMQLTTSVNAETSAVGIKGLFARITTAHTAANAAGGVVGTRGGF